MPSQRPTTAADKPTTRQRTPSKGSWTSGRWMLVLLALVCAAPVIASYLMYYVFKPAGGTSSYGKLIDPQRPIPSQLVVTDEKGQTLPFKSLEGKWLMITVNGGDCNEQCVTRLYYMRQVRVLQSAERDRVVNVWLRTDDKPVADVIKAAYPQPDTRMLIADPRAVADWLPVTDGTKLTDHIFLVDPNGNLMMRFPKDPDPKKINADLAKLLKWSRIG
ncbi:MULTISPECIES: cytochrome C oxidase subunit I [unclassified Caballeronia]|uniref:SCO family protein n=1 Tax=unclassified Caballeronia TaxID=2646786 RepID=UPI0028654DDA|nr:MULTISPECIES: cytochrome C oxidase subunit I [unclassified Caballeronia]MDR5736821.1 cytochrome C oxidase subunit I [Caballeronia sp. LZ016]MDR5810698.1 cytochrome C oxidase subunit I [Caballeronia sp. LZ019]